jgi:hypothetical protein
MGSAIPRGERDVGQGDVNIDLPEGYDFAPDPQRVAEFEAMLAPTPFHLGPPGHDRAPWERLAATDIGRRLQVEAEALAAQEPLPLLSDELYLSCLRDHSPAAFNAVAPDVRARMALLPVAECLDPSGRYLERIEADLAHALALRSWTHPNNDDDRDTFDGRTTFNDLSSLQMACLLIAADHLLGERLAADTRRSIRDEVTRRVLEPFRGRIESGQDGYWWFTVSHNWNSVCLLHTLACALYLHDDVHDRAWYLATAELWIEHSEKGFTETGFYTEGVGYWAYGFGCYVALAEIVRCATGGAVDWMTKPRVAKAAGYGARMEIQEGVYPTFADCRRDIVLPDWLVHWTTCRRESPEDTSPAPVPLDPLSGRPFRTALTGLIVLFHLKKPAETARTAPRPALREWYEDVQFLICRPSPQARVRLASTFKGGDNGANHNHNDLGTFTVLVGDRELLTDPGAEVYTKRTFSRQRYAGDLLNSFGHPVPLVAGRQQPPLPGEYTVGVGRDVFARVRESSFTDAADSVTLDLSGDYRVPILRELTRRFTHEREGDGRIEVVDRVRYEVAAAFETALITYAQWSLDDGVLRVHDGDAAVEVRVTCDEAGLLFDHCVIDESSTPTRLSWRLATDVEAATVRMVVTPAG